MRLPFENPAAPTPAILQWARERMNYTVEQAAQKLGKDVAHILDWESGTGFPTYPQLEKLADFYRIPVAVFFFPSPPELEDAKLNFRLLPIKEREKIDPDTLQTAYHGEAIQDLLKEAHDGINPSRSPVHKIVSLDITENMAEKALAIREAIGINMEKQSSWKSYQEAFHAWRSAVEENGIYIFQHHFAQSIIDGFCIADEDFPIMFLDNQKIETRKIFTIAHELAHIFLGVNSITVEDTDFINDLDAQDQAIEMFCNRIANEILIPQSDFQNQFSQKSVTDDGFYKNASRRYWVSKQVILYKCLNLNWVDYSQFENIMGDVGDYRNRNLQTSSGGSFYRNQVSYWGERFLSEIIQKGHDGKISMADLSNLLRMKISTIFELEGHIELSVGAR